MCRGLFHAFSLCEQRGLIQPADELLFVEELFPGLDILQVDILLQGRLPADLTRLGLYSSFRSLGF